MFNEVKCPDCFSENVYFSKKHNSFCCEECGVMFEQKKEFVSQKVFISYGHDKNRDIVNVIKDRLKKRGHNPWIDSIEIAPGNDWRSKIESGIYGSDKFLAFISQHSVRNPGVCLDEIAIALGIRQCNIQSILLEKNITAPNSISSIQWLDFSEWEEKKHVGGLVWEKWFDAKMETLYEIVESPENIKRSGELIEIKKRLKPLLPDEKIRFLLDNQLIQRKWLLEEIKNKIEHNKVVFLIGNPGSGKSIYCAILSNYISSTVASYFIDWQNIDTQKAENLVLSLSFQIACGLPDYRYEMVKILPYINVENSTPMTLCEKILIEPLNRMIDGGRDKTLVIVDAIDELSENVQEEFIDIVEKLIISTPAWIVWLFTTRPNEKIVKRFSSYSTVKLELFASNTQEDIKEFIDIYIENNDVRQVIFNKCEGSFFYAKELIEAVKKNTIISSDIEKIPNGISNIYEKNFNRLIGKRISACEKNILMLIMYAYENISVDEIAYLLEINTEKVKVFVKKLESYLRVLKKNGKEYIVVVHKSIVDWMKNTEESIYYLDESKANTLFAEIYLNKMRNNERISEYLCFYGFEHLLRAKKWIELSYYEKKDILEKCIELSKEYGNIQREYRYIDIYTDGKYDELNTYLYLLDLSIRSNQEINIELIDSIKRFSDYEKDAKKQYLLREKLAIALFYLGHDETAHKILNKEKEDKKEMFEQNNDINATWNHAISLVSHDMDLNEDTVNTSLMSADMYFKQDKTYEYLISLVNLFDAYMGCGKLSEAHKYAEKVACICDEKYYVHVIDIYKICYANLLQTEGRVMESLAWYEQGLAIAKEIQSWDYLYGSIWRELAIAKFYDKSCLGRLDNLSNECERQKFSYLQSLASCFYILSSWKVGEYNSDLLKKHYDVVKIKNLPGHLLQTEIAIQFIGLKCNDINDWRMVMSEANSVIKQCIKKCQGVKGMPEIIYEYIEKKYIDLTYDEEHWYTTYIFRIVEEKENYLKRLYEKRASEETPYLKAIRCTGCEAKCCYDGVYLRTKDEEERIKKLIEMYPEEFITIPEDYIVDGTWPGMEDMRKTNVCSHEYKCLDFPLHFSKTRCVFEMDTGECLLQRVATDHQLHPWFAKPTACWLFPIRGFDNNSGKIIAPLDYNEKDPDYIDENYPGYASYLPCGKALGDSINKNEDILNYKSWRELFANEIEYYDYLKRNDNI